MLLPGSCPETCGKLTIVVLGLPCKNSSGVKGNVGRPGLRAKERLVHRES